MNDMLKKLKD